MSEEAFQFANLLGEGAQMTMVLRHLLQFLPFRPATGFTGADLLIIGARVAAASGAALASFLGAFTLRFSIPNVNLDGSAATE